MTAPATRGDLTDFLNALGQRESSNDYSVVNSLGYLGRYQFGELALIDAGYYAGRDGSSSNDFSGGWTGRLGVTSKAAFLASTEAQDDAARVYVEKLWSYIRALDLEFYAQQSLNSVDLSISGMIGGAWLVGSGGLRTFITSGGTSAPGDANATKVTEYIELLADYDLSSLGVFVTNHEKGNILVGGTEADTLRGFDGNDVLTGDTGSDVLDGGAGHDQAVYSGARSSYTIVEMNGMTTVTNGADTDQLTGIEELRFDDAVVSLVSDAEAVSAQVYRLYQAAFGRTPDTVGLSHNAALVETSALDLEQMAQAFIASAEFVRSFGTAPSDADFVTLLYSNVLGRQPDDPGLSGWLDRLSGGSYERADVLLGFSESPENRALVADAISDGFWIG